MPTWKQTEIEKKEPRNVKLTLQSGSFSSPFCFCFTLKFFFFFPFTVFTFISYLSDLCDLKLHQRSSNLFRIRKKNPVFSPPHQHTRSLSLLLLLFVNTWEGSLRAPFPSHSQHTHTHTHYPTC